MRGGAANSLDARGENVVVCTSKCIHIPITEPGSISCRRLGGANWGACEGGQSKIRQTREEPEEFGDPASLESRAFQVLEISEKGTIGLVGPEAVRTEQDERRWPGEPPKAYIALTRDDARRETGPRVWRHLWTWEGGSLGRVTNSNRHILFAPCHS